MLVLLATGCTDGGDSDEQATNSTDSSAQTTQTSEDSTSEDPTSDEEGNSSTDSTDEPSLLEDSTDASGDSGGDSTEDDTIPTPPSLVPGDEFCEPTRVTGQAIRFQPQAEAALLRSPSEPGQSDLYSVEVRDRQILSIEITSPDADVVATLLPPDGIFIPGTFVETVVTETRAGNYWICVVSGDLSDRYELSISVIDNNTPTRIVAEWCGSTVNDRGEIRFAAGTSSGAAENAVILGERDLYTLEAGEGQQLEGTITALEDNAAVQVRSPSGDIIVDAETNTPFSEPLPASGVYEICIGGTRGNASYTLDLTIE